MSDVGDAAVDEQWRKLRKQHGRIDRVEGQIVDSAGNIGDPFVAETLLAKLERRGDIDHVQRRAGEQFHRLFQRAALDPLRAADLARVPACGGDPHAHSSVAAERQIRAVIAILGGNASLAGSVAWHCLGEDRSIRQWAIMHGRDAKVAKGILVAVLDELARFWA